MMPPLPHDLPVPGLLQLRAPGRARRRRLIPEAVPALRGGLPRPDSPEPSHRFACIARICTDWWAVLPGGVHWWGSRGASPDSGTGDPGLPSRKGAAGHKGSSCYACWSWRRGSAEEQRRHLPAWCSACKRHHPATNQERLQGLKQESQQRTWPMSSLLVALGADVIQAMSQVSGSHPGLLEKHVGEFLEETLVEETRQR